MHIFSEGIFRLPSYSHALFGMSIIHIYASLLLVLFFAGCTVPFMLHASSRQTILLHAGFTGLIAASLARVLLFYTESIEEMSEGDQIVAPPARQIVDEKETQFTIKVED